jgi:hypothetical protein
VAHGRLDDIPLRLREAQEATYAEVAQREAQNYSRAEAQTQARIIRNLADAQQQQAQQSRDTSPRLGGKRGPTLGVAKTM